MNKGLQIAKSYLQKLKTQGIEITNAYLYGSYAKGTAKPYSDIDICVISANFGKDYWEEERKLRNASLKVDPRIEPVVFNPQDFDNKYDTLATEIRKYGIPLEV